jgi:hypothetical protein
LLSHPPELNSVRAKEVAVMKAILIFAAVLGLVILPLTADSRNFEGDGSNSRGYVDRVAPELAIMGKRGAVVEDVRERTIALLQTNDACAAWYEEWNPDVADVFRSLHYTIEDDQHSYTLRKYNDRGMQMLKSPWAAHTIQYGGRESMVRLNINGPFFRRISPVLDTGSRRWISPIGHTRLGVAEFSGDTTEAQITILLHELGHVIGRLPLDTDSWDGQSSRNTVEVLRHCKPEITEAAQKNWQQELQRPLGTGKNAGTLSMR